MYSGSRGFTRVDGPFFSEIEKFLVIRTVEAQGRFSWRIS